MKIKSISFLNGWEGRQSIRIKATMEDGTEVVIEKVDAERILIEAFAQGYELTLAPMQKLYRIKIKNNGL